MQSRVEQLEDQVADLTEEVEVLSSGLSALVCRLERKAERVIALRGRLLALRTPEATLSIL